MVVDSHYPGGEILVAWVRISTASFAPTLLIEMMSLRTGLQELVDRWRWGNRIPMSIHLFARPSLYPLAITRVTRSVYCRSAVSAVNIPKCSQIGCVQSHQENDRDLDCFVCMPWLNATWTCLLYSVVVEIVIRCVQYIFSATPNH